jgi:large subunit ribosomal protein L21
VCSDFSLSEAGSQGNEALVSSAKKPFVSSQDLGETGLNTEKTMFAVIKTGGKQYKVAAEDTITIMHLAGEAGASITFNDVLMVVEADKTKVGAPLVAGASVTGQIVGQERGPKVIAFKKRRRKNSKRKRGHRQDLTVVKITGIAAGA